MSPEIVQKIDESVHAAEKIEKVNCCCDQQMRIWIQVYPPCFQQKNGRGDPAGMNGSFFANGRRINVICTF